MGIGAADLPADVDLSRLSEHWFIVHDGPDVSDLEPGVPDSATLERELRREVSREHVLYGIDVHVIAFRRRRKEIIVWAPTIECWAWVHLTWSKETDPAFPGTVLLADWGSVLAELEDAGRQ